MRRGRGCSWLTGVAHLARVAEDGLRQSSDLVAVQRAGTATPELGGSAATGTAAEAQPRMHTATPGWLARTGRRRSH